ncbi:MAG TPA: aminotransferase class I/II-fold pyridoxal phosphate-dependent enzyme [Chloroflexota bacterium]|nr:aminotransferase class I/II-fold pyridoxal phosphate-dependent enzyme [Chloroflexota bacterium]
MRVAERTLGFTESVIREMTRLVNKYHPDDGINMAQGFPDFPAPDLIKRAACDAINADLNQYAITWGAKNLRDAIAEKTATFLGFTPDPEREITVCCGATEAMIAVLLAVVNPGDEVVIFEPFYENYGPDAILSGAQPRYVSLRPPDWTFDPAELAAAFSPRTRALILNTPNNPTGKVFDTKELDVIGDLCRLHDALVITDEIYEHMVYDGLRHVSMASLPGMRERTVVINGMSKTYAVTGWRVGYVIAPAAVSDAVRKVHDFLTVGAAAPLQEAGAVALRLPPEYYDNLRREYEQRRDFIVEALSGAGFGVFRPHGAYYVMTDINAFEAVDDVAFADWLVRDVGIAVVPGSSFYSDPAKGSQQVRFAFPKRMQTLEAAAQRLSELKTSARHSVLASR